MSELIRWICHHPRRLYTVALLTGAAVVGLTVAFTPDLPHPGAAVQHGDAAVTTPVGHTPPTPSTDPGPSGPFTGPPPDTTPAGQDAAAAGRVALAFTTAWAAHPAGQVQRQWLAALSPYVTGRLRDLLAYTDVIGQPNRWPSGSPTPRYSAATSAQLVIGLSDGSRVAVTVVRDSGIWKVFDIEPDAGDGALAPG